MVKRQRDARGPSYPPLVVNEPVAGNYYPVNSMISLDDGRHELAVVTDVTMGGASMADGELEIMPHRRCQKDDSRGVQEPLNETMCGCNDIGAAPGKMGAHGREADGGCHCEGLTMRGSAYVVFDRVEQAHATRRQLVETLNFPPTLAFTKASAVPKPKFSAIADALPPNVKLMTISSNYADWNQGQAILRLSHLYQVDEHPVLFPNILRVGQGRNFGFQMRIPIDDTHTHHFVYRCRVPNPGEVVPEVPDNEIPVVYEKVYKDNGRVRADWVLGQDQAAWIIQGPITDRTDEHLGATDVGIILFRKLLNENIKIVEDGGDPINVHRQDKGMIYLPQEHSYYPGFENTGGPFADKPNLPPDVEMELADKILADFN